MAGCLPMHFPAVLTAFAAMLEPEFLLHGATASTGGCAVFIVLNGPIRRELGAAGSFNALGNSDRATAVIGRAIRLALINILEVRPGGIDRSTLGHPGKFSYCVAEDEEDSAWLPLHAAAWPAAGGVRRHRHGRRRAAADHERVDHGAGGDPGNLRRRDARQHAALFDLGRQLCADHTAAIARAPAGRAAGARPTSPRSSTLARGSIGANGPTVGKGAVVRERGDTEYAALGSPDELLVVAAGGPAGGFGAVIPPWLGHKSRAVTLPIGACVDCEPPER